MLETIVPKGNPAYVIVVKGRYANSVSVSNTGYDYFLNRTTRGVCIAASNDADGKYLNLRQFIRL